MTVSHRDPLVVLIIVSVLVISFLFILLSAATLFDAVILLAFAFALFAYLLTGASSTPYHIADHVTHE